MSVNTNHIIDVKPDDVPIWGAEAMAEEINRTRRATYHLLHTGQLDATKKGSTWVSTRRRLRRSLGAEE